MQGKNFDVFISYRRSDGDKVARILDLAFKNAGYRTFLDYNSIEGGLFEQKIKVAIEDAPVFVMVMTPDYFKRCNEDGDWVRKEIELALVNEKTIIPISIDNIVDKVPTDLDEDFRAKVGAHNFAIVYTNSIFEVSFEKMLKERIQKVSDIIQNARNKAKVKVTADADCDLKRGDELIATLQAGRENLIYISGGQYKLKAVSCDYRDIQQDISINISNVSFEYDFDVNLADKVKARRNDIQGPNYAEIAKQKAEAERIAREKAEAERREKERRQREEEERRRREERERRKEELKEWWERNKSKCVMLLAVIAGAVAGTWCIKNCEGTTETATETAVETITESNTNNNDSVKKQNIDVSKFVCIKTKKENCGHIWKISYSKDGKFINVVGDEYIKKLTNDLDSCISNIKLYTYGTGDISNEGLIVRNNGKILEILNNEGKCIRTLEGHSNDVLSVCWSPDGKYLASGSGDETIKIWDAESGKCIKTLIGHYWPVHFVNWNHNSDKIISWVNSGSSFKIWDANSGKCLKTLKHSMYVSSVEYSYNEKYIASASLHDVKVIIWDANSGERIRTLDGHSEHVRSVCWSPDGKYLASGSYDKTVKIWDANSGECIRTLEGHSDEVLSVCWSPDGKYLVSGSWDKTVRIWGVE